MTSYVVVGDSQAEGLGMSVALPRALGDNLVEVFDRRGASTRNLVDSGAMALAAGSAANHDATVLVFAGGNDNDVMESAASLSRYKDALADALRVFARKSAAAGKPLRVIWFGPVFAREEWNARQHPQAARAQAAFFGSSEARRAIAEVPMANVSVRWVDSQPLTRDLARPENVHLSADGYRVFADRVVGAVEGGGAFMLILAAAAGYAGWRWWRDRR